MKVCTKLNYVSTPICLWIAFYFYHLGSEERKFVNGKITGKFHDCYGPKNGSKNLLYNTGFSFTFTAALADFPHFCKDSGFFFL